MDLRPTALPPNFYPSDTPRFLAYARCLELESSLDNASDKRSFSPQVCGRILGYMMREAPTDGGCHNVQEEILSCTDDKALRDLAQFYATYFLRLFKKAKGRTPGSSSHPSRPSFDDTQETIMFLMEQATKSHQAAKQLALKRDDYRCVVTGAYDAATFQKRFKADPTFTEPAPPRFTQMAHIFPDSLSRDPGWPDDLPGKKAEYSATAWADVERFGQANVLTESLNGSDIHPTENVLTMCTYAHDLFDKLELWFEATGVPNTYKIRSNVENNFKILDPRAPDQVILTSTNPLIPLPNSHYLRIHAACARVAHLSGAAEYLEAILDEWEERPILASDGGSADMLSFLLARAAVAAHQCRA